MELIDTHCHLTELSPEELDRILTEAENAEVKKLICVGASNGLEPNIKTTTLTDKYSNIFGSIGIHPHDAGKLEWTNDLEKLAEKTKIVAIGETGLDFFKNWSDFEEQKKLFRKTIHIAKNLNKPLIIHCRDAHEETFKILKQEGASSVGGVFHCFGEDLDIAKKVFELNFLISFTGILTFKNALKLRNTAKEVDLNRVMLETDSPYMAPEPFRGRQSHPAHVRIIAETLAAVHNVTLEEISEKTSNNAKRLFRF